MAEWMRKMENMEELIEYCPSCEMDELLTTDDINTGMDGMNIFEVIKYCPSCSYEKIIFSKIIGQFGKLFREYEEVQEIGETNVG